jgi:hypothetical protein
VRAHNGTWLLGLCAALALSVPSWLPWLDPRITLWQGTPGVDDAKNHLLRTYVLGWLVSHGAWFPRWFSDLFLGYGYPLFNYYAPASYYLALVERLVLRLDVWDAYRLLGVIGTLVGAGGAYALVTDVWRRPLLGVLSAVCLIYFPYAFQVNLFRRGDMPELLGLALIPWLLLTVRRLWRAAPGPRTAGWLAMAGGVGAIEILTHNLTALFAALGAAAWALGLALEGDARRGAPRVALAGVLAVGLTSFFWLPAIAEGGAVQLEWLRDEGLNYRIWFVRSDGRSLREEHPDNRQTRGGVIDTNVHYPHQLLAPPKLSLGQAGVGALTLALTATTLATSGRRRRVGPILALVVGAAVSWLMTLAVSEPVWATLSPLSFIQFPWRWMGPLAVSLSLGAGGALAAPLATLNRGWSRSLGTAAVVGIGALVMFNSLGARDLPLVDPGTLPDRRVDGARLRRDELEDPLSMGTTSGREFMPREVELATYTRGLPRGAAVFETLYPDLEWVGGLFHPLVGQLRVQDWRSGPGWVTARVTNDGTRSPLGIHQTRLPGWRAWIDGAPAPIGVSPLIPEQQATPAFMVVDVPPGEHTVTLAFGPTTPRLIGAAVSLVTLSAATALGAATLWPRSPRGRAAVLVGVTALFAAQGLVAYRSVRPLFARPPLGDGETALMVNVAEAARVGRASISSPSGATLGPDAFVDVRFLAVTDTDAPQRGAAATARREWLYAHPPTTIAVDVRLPKGRSAWFQSSVALRPEAWETPTGDGVRLEVSVAPLDEAGVARAATVVLDEVVNPRAQTGQRRWLPVVADLSPWAGHTVRLTLHTDARADPTFDWAGWGDPVVFVRESARANLLQLRAPPR